MSPRITRLASDWKTYLAIITGISAALSALPGVFEGLEKSIHGVVSLPPELKYVAAGVLALFALAAAISAWSKRSILLRPDRFIVSAKDPEHLIGRESEIRDLAQECEASPLIFLEGESGTGKSALARAGLFPFLRAATTDGEILPVVLDASALSWQDGLRIELARALGRLSPDERKLLGVADDLSDSDVLTKLAAVSRTAARRLLLILDQVDDYLIAQRAHMRGAHTVLTPEELALANPDWAAVAGLVKDGRLRLLLICRNDIFSRLDSFRFAKVTTFSLERIAPKLISPLLDQVTHDDGKGAVIENPDYGWTQLKKRLLRDLSGDTQQILPIQLAIALDSLRLFRTLTIGEYARKGGARGLERLHIQRHLTDIARSRGLSESALLQGLMLLVTERGQKTQRASREDFSQAILGRAAVGSELDPVIEHLERSRILRRQVSDEGEYLLLHHDYLARGIWEAHGQANRWLELLRQRSRQFDDALTLLQRWRALLPATAFVQLLWQRLRGRFRFGEHGAFARWSLLRFAPLLPLLACLWLGWRWVDIMDQQKFAAGAFLNMNRSEEFDQNEARAWAHLANAKEDARFRAAQQGVANPTVAFRLSSSGRFSHAIVGLDPTGRLRERFASEIVLPTLQSSQTDRISLRAVSTIDLPWRRPDALRLATACAVRLGTEKKADEISELCVALVRFAESLEPGDLQPIVTSLTARMKGAPNSEAAALFRAVLVELCPKLGTKDVQSIAHELVDLMTKTVQDSGTLYGLAQSLGAVSSKLPSEEVRSAALALLNRMDQETNPTELARLGSAFRAFSSKLPPADIQAAAAALCKPMDSEMDGNKVGQLSRALSGLSAQLKPSDLRPASDALLRLIKKAEYPTTVADCASAFGPHGGKLEDKDLQAAAAGLLERMHGEKNDFQNLYEWASLLADFATRLDAMVLQPAAELLVERLNTERDNLIEFDLVFAQAVRALGGLTDRLGPEDIRPLAETLVGRMETEKKSVALAKLGKAVAVLTGRLKAPDVEALVARLVTRMGVETESEALCGLGEGLASLPGWLETGNLKPAASALVVRMEKEEKSSALVHMGETLARLKNALKPEDLRPATKRLIEKIGSEEDDASLRKLSRTLAALSDFAPDDAKRAATALVKKMQADRDSDALDDLGSALGLLSGKLQDEDVQPAATVLIGRIERIKAEPDPDTNVVGLCAALSTLRPHLTVNQAQSGADALADDWRKGVMGSDIGAKAWIELEAVANRGVEHPKRMQKYVDVLALPLVVGDGRKALVDGLEALAKEAGDPNAKFESDVWKFVDWATTTRNGKDMKLNLDQRPHWRDRVDQAQ